MKILFFILTFSLLFGQNQDDNSFNLFPSAESVLDSMEHNFERIEDYNVQIEVSIKTPILRMPRKKVEFWYKKPNLTKAEAKGFAAIPKSGLISSPVDLFDNLSDINVVGAEYYKDNQVWILRGELHSDSLTFKDMGDFDSQFRLNMRMYVDRERWILLKSETWMDTTKILEIESDYKKVKDDIYLPNETSIKFEYSKDLKSELNNSFHSNNQIMNMKKDMVLESDIAEEIDKKEFSGSITLKFSKYKVNQGLEDSFFQKEESE